MSPTNEVVDPRPRDIFLGLDLCPDVVVAQSDFFSQLRQLGVRVHFVVYDLLPVLMPHRFPVEARDGHERWLQVVAGADSALCISRSVADELRSWIEANGAHRQRPFHIDWFHLGADLEQSNGTRGMPVDAAPTLREMAVRPTFVLVGTLEPRKGHAQTLDAFEMLWGSSTDVNLVFIGKQGWKVDSLVRRLRPHEESGRRLFWLDGISDEYLGHIYQASGCLICPSEGEGFGLPLIEAARYGTPILARDIPTHREVAGEHAFYFDGFEPSDLAGAVTNWLTLWREGRHPRSEGIRFQTWEQSSAQVVDILLKERPSPDACAIGGPK